MTAIASVVVAVSLGDMLVHNRRKRNEWMLVQQELHQRELALARQSLAQGTANEDQMLLINRERAKEEAELIKLNKKGVLARAKEALFSGMDKEEVKGGSFGKLKDGEMRVSAAGTVTRPATGEGVLRAVQDTVQEGKERLLEGKERLIEGKDYIKAEIKQHSPAKPVIGGPLDQYAQKAASDAASSTKGWTNWVFRK